MEDAAPDSAETQRRLQRLRAGEPQVLDELFARRRSYLSQLVELRLDRKFRRRVDPSDVVQEVLLEAKQKNRMEQKVTVYPGHQGSAHHDIKVPTDPVYP